MRSDIYSGLRIDQPIFVRVDGVNFSTLCDFLGFEKPYDERLVSALSKAAEHVMERLNPKLAYIFSDEINFFFTTPLPYDGRVEKMDSVIPSMVAGALSMELGTPTAFDSRIIIGDIIEYLSSRQGEAWRNHINSYAFYSLLSKGMDRRGSAAMLRRMKSHEIHEFMFKRGVNLAKTPTWQRRGIIVCKETYEKRGFDPIGKKDVTVERKRVKVYWDLPIFHKPEGRSFLEALVD
jgi:tRNA(His) 5'-end guanylyltransferase